MPFPANSEFDPRSSTALQPMKPAASRETPAPSVAKRAGPAAGFLDDEEAARMRRRRNSRVEGWAMAVRSGLIAEEEDRES